jgi:pterin-4a-carbinolamine dehydratase
LRKAFFFRSLTAPAQFVNDILGPAGIAEKEGVSFFLFLSIRLKLNFVQHHPDRIQIKSLEVLLSLKTHSAFIRDDFKKRVVKPGLTDRDLRLAILIERMFYEQIGYNGSGPAMNGEGLFYCQPTSLSDVDWNLSGKNIGLEFSED